MHYEAQEAPLPATTAAVAVITPCLNEESTLAALVSSIAEQSHPPSRWIIVDDGSTDGSVDLARSLTAGLPWAEVIALSADSNGDRNFSKKARAVNTGYERMQQDGVTPDFIACVDADVELPSDFFEVAVQKFDDDSELGVTGGRFLHPVNGELKVRKEHDAHVPGPAQVFRRETFDAIGGYLELRHGGIDTVANYLARREGWTTSTFDDLTFTHARQMGTGGGRSLMRAAYQLGQQDWDLGTLPEFEALKVVKDLREEPIVIGSLLRAVGYLISVVRRRDRSTPPDVQSFIRAEQRARLEELLPSWFPLRPDKERF